MHKKSVPLIRQMGTTDCGIAALTMIFQYYKYKIDISELKATTSIGRNGMSLAKMKEITEEHNFSFKAYGNYETEENLIKCLPIIMCSKENHYVVVAEKKYGKYILLDPLKGKEKVDYSYIKKNFLDVLVCVRPTEKNYKREKRESFLIPINKSKLFLASILTLVTQGIILIPPLIIKKIVNEITYDTLGFNFVKYALLILSVALSYLLANLYIQLLKDFLEIKEGENALGGTKVDNIKTIELRNVSFDYPQCKMALSTINLKIKSNEQIAIVGKNGSGKSTLFKILCGLYKPTSGKLFVNNLDLENIDVKSYRNCISVLFQDFLKYEGTLEENVYIGDISTEVDENKIKNSLCKANVDFLKTERGYELKRGLGNWFDEGGQLSGGQWQKIALARTYYKNADLYLLDEPSSALDVTAETKIFKSFFEVSKNKIAIYITHRVKIAQDANKIIVLDGGKIVGIGTHAELLKNCSVYQDLYNQENLKNKG